MLGFVYESSSVKGDCTLPENCESNKNLLFGNNVKFSLYIYMILIVASFVDKNEPHCYVETNSKLI